MQYLFSFRCPWIIQFNDFRFISGIYKMRNISTRIYVFSFKICCNALLSIHFKSTFGETVNDMLASSAKWSCSDAADSKWFHFWNSYFHSFHTNTTTRINCYAMTIIRMDKPNVNSMTSINLNEIQFQNISRIVAVISSGAPQRAHQVEQIIFKSVFILILPNKQRQTQPHTDDNEYKSETIYSKLN